MNDTELRELAIKRLEERADLRNYLWIWLGVSVLVIGIWATTNWGGYFWPAWPILGMGIGAFAKAVSLTRGGITEDAISAESARISR